MEQAVMQDEALKKVRVGEVRALENSSVYSMAIQARNEAEDLAIMTL